MKALGHRPVDYATMAETVALALSVDAGLRVMSVATLLTWLDRLSFARAKIETRPSYSLDRFASAAYRLLPIEGTCLRESLVLYGLLKRRGAMPRLCVGVKKDGVELAAHAWIECDGTRTAGGEEFVELTTSP